MFACYILSDNFRFLVLFFFFFLLLSGSSSAFAHKGFMRLSKLRVVFVPLLFSDVRALVCLPVHTAAEKAGQRRLAMSSGLVQGMDVHLGPFVFCRMQHGIT